MRETHRRDRFVVFDDFLDEATLTELRGQLDRSTFSEVNSVIYPDTDGQAYRSRGAYLKGAALGSPGGGGRPKAYEKILSVVAAEPGIFGANGDDWDRAAFTFWRYPAGSRLSWHNDVGGGRRGEYILFLHDTWKASWGGELMILDEDPPPASSADFEDFIAQMELQVRRSRVSPVAILPKPNRLVLVRAGTAHQINRVDPTAGSERRTLTGFISKKSNENTTEARDALLRLMRESAGAAR
ncbi:2OG-Fe(II) oxygenase [Streptomyces sp. DSM 44915]|uniref:2OG-Fe(II) oxygenase n=1 Tax=Streptomyces chisholmiae TaxID=3075540 RepID=A0ABU2JR35_9ACTN|nr:2OG-Fe(II) oxygenase [Streptomyces sp. DSM 44915]MDT0267445.1 2OG-Fe(II) oxygenase [Streptomyces sp. DSM 44915]